MYRQDEPEINLEQILQRVRNFFSRFRLGGGGGSNIIALIVFGILVVSAIGWLATGFYQVDQGERAALRLFGDAEPDTRGPGLKWWWPAPIGTRSIESVEEVRQLELGFRGGQPVPIESMMITGDENIVDAQLLVQYDIKDLNQFLFSARDPDGIILKSAAEASLRQVVGQGDIDAVLTTEKEAVQQETKELLQFLLDLYETGINVREVRLQNVTPPQQVQDAFDDVVRAREDKERIINLAQAYEADIIPRAEGDATRVKEGAEAFKQERVAAATGQASRFSQVLQSYRGSPEVTRTRLFLEAMEEILPGVTKFIIDSEGGSGNLLQFLPLTPDATETQLFPVPQITPAPTPTP